MEIDVFTELTITLSRGRASEQQKSRAICRVLQQVLPAANRVTLWRFENNFSQIVCTYHMQANQKADATGSVLQASDFPEYFKAILREQVLVASHARHHPVTRCFADNYFAENDIYSLMDYNFHSDFSPIGVICCESTGVEVQWSQSDIAHLKRVASIASMFC